MVLKKNTCTTESHRQVWNQRGGRKEKYKTQLKIHGHRTSSMEKENLLFLFP